MTLGAAASRVIRSMLTRMPATYVLQAALTKDESAGGRAAILPARVGPAGIFQVERPPLSSRDRVRLETTLAR